MVFGGRLSLREHGLAGHLRLSDFPLALCTNCLVLTRALLRGYIKVAPPFNEPQVFPDEVCLSVLEVCPSRSSTARASVKAPRLSKALQLKSASV